MMIDNILVNILIVRTQFRLMPYLRVREGNDHVIDTGIQFNFTSSPLKFCGTTGTTSHASIASKRYIDINSIGSMTRK